MPLKAFCHIQFSTTAGTLKPISNLPMSSLSNQIHPRFHVPLHTLRHSIDKQHCQNLRVISNQSTFLVTLGTLPYYIVFHSKLNETHINLCTFSPSLPCHTQSCGHSYISCHNRFFPAWPIIIISTDSCYVHQELPSLLRYYSLQTMHV